MVTEITDNICDEHHIIVRVVIHQTRETQVTYIIREQESI